MTKKELKTRTIKKFIHICSQHFFKFFWGFGDWTW